MKRRGFLRSVGAVAGAAVVIPAVAAASPKTEPAPVPEPAIEPAAVRDDDWRGLEYERDEMLLERIRESPWYQAAVLEIALRERYGALPWAGVNVEFVPPIQPEMISRACNFPRYAPLTPAPPRNP